MHSARVRPTGRDHVFGWAKLPQLATAAVAGSFCRSATERDKQAVVVCTRSGSTPPQTPAQVLHAAVSMQLNGFRPEVRDDTVESAKMIHDLRPSATDGLCTERPLIVARILDGTRREVECDCRSVDSLIGRTGGPLLLSLSRKKSWSRCLVSGRQSPERVCTIVGLAG